LRDKIAGILVAVAVMTAPLGFVFGSVRVGDQGGQSLELRFDISGIQEVKDGEGRWAGLKIPDFICTFDESLGLWIPMKSYLVAVPVGADVKYQVIDATYYEIDDYDLGRIAAAGGLRDMPGKPAEVVRKGYVGSQRVASLRIAPLVYDAAAGKLKVYEGFGVRFDFVGAEPRESGPVGTGAWGGSSFEETLNSAILNYEQGRGWRRTAVASFDQGDYFSSSPAWVKIRVESSGVYCITGADLAAIGVSVGSIEAGTIRLYSGGGLPLNESIVDTNPSWMRQVPVRVSRQAGSFAQGDSILFYGLGARDWADFYDSRYGRDTYSKSFYSDFNCYWLTWGGVFQEEPARIEKIGQPPCDGCTPYTPLSFLERRHVEQDSPNLIDYSVPAEDGWYWRPLIRGTPVVLYANTFSPDTARPARIKVRVADWHQSRDCLGDYFRVLLRLNGATIKDMIWQVGMGIDRVVDIDTVGTLANLDQQPIAVEIPLTLPPGHPGSVCDRLYLAWYEMSYWRKFVARGDGLFFLSPDTTAITRYEITGFTTSSLYVFDVSDQFDVKELKGAQVSGESGLFKVALLDTTRKGDLRRYAVVSPAALRKPLEMKQTQVTSIRQRNGTDYCVITYKDLIGPAATISSFHGGDVVTVDEIYDEFAWGVPDATAIRDFLRWRYTHGHPFFRVLLLGDATLDIKGRLAAGTYLDYVPSYERRYLPPVGNPYSTDDWFAYLVPDDGDSVAYWPTIPISRIPAASPEEGALVVSHTLEYTTQPELGVWQNRVMLVADDDRIGTSCGGFENNLHTFYAEELSDKAYPQVFDRAKVYLTEYPVESTGLKTLARKDFLKNLNEGVLITNYVGHGDQYRLAQEEVFSAASVGLVSAGKRLTFFIASSCNVSRFDDPAGSSMSEELLKRQEGGTVGSLASTHLCLPGPNQALNMNFIYTLFDSTRGKHPTPPIADAVQIAKVLTVPLSRNDSYWTNDEMYALLGDPALRLASPALDVAITAAAPDTLHRKGIYRFSAKVKDGLGVADGFNGLVDVRIREAEDTSGYVTCTGSFLDYDLPGKEIYRSKGLVENDTLGFTAFIPVDAREGRRGAVRCFVMNDSTSGSGLLDSLVIHGESVSEDNVGPEINLVRDGESLRPEGDSVIVGERLLISLADESGVAVKAKSQFIPAVSISIDGGERQDITDSVYAIDGRFEESVASFVVPQASGDSLALAISAFDNVNNLSTREYRLFVSSPVVQASNVVYAYPNPASDFCYVICDYGTRLVTVDVAIYTLSGRKIWKQGSSDAKAYHEIPWDGTDMEGDRVANGTYIVKVEAKDPLDPGFKMTKTIIVALIR
jgi:hypothetical protein